MNPRDDWAPLPEPHFEVNSHGLVIDATTAADDPLVDEFYAGYDQAFVLPNEKESLRGFRECLALNAGADYRRLHGRYGPYREVVAVVRDVPGGAIVGGANFIAFPLRATTELLSVNLNYVFVSAPRRGQGRFRRLVEAMPDIAHGAFLGSSKSARTLVFIEQNHPHRMSPADYRLDTETSGLDQWTRIAIWTRLGARLIDFPYIQPPLSSDQEPDRTLLYGVLGASGDTLDACLLHDHLERFFGISVLKGMPLEGSEVARDQLAALRDRCRAKIPVRFLALEELKA
jgi:hypothetical protein